VTSATRPEKSIRLLIGRPGIQSENTRLGGNNRP
jgi:hypothetical protein